MNAEVIEGSLHMLDETNELCKELWMVRDRFESNDLVDLKVEFKVCRSNSGRENHISASDDVAGIMVGSSNNTTSNRDVIIEPSWTSCNVFLMFILNLWNYSILFSFQTVKMVIMTKFHLQVRILSP